jgi:hypothetical protein
MSASVLGVVTGFREEGDTLVYLTSPVPDVSRDTTWFFDELGKRGQRKLLIDMRGSGAVTQGFRTVVYKRHHELDAHRIAVLGNSRFQEFVVSFLLAATGHAGARYFHEEAAARAWLREERHG